MQTLTLAILVAVMVCATVCQTNGQNSSAGDGKLFDKMNTTMTKKMEEPQKDGKKDIGSVLKKTVEFMKVKVKEFFGSDSNNSHDLFSTFKNMTTEGGSDQFKNLMKKMKNLMKKKGGGDSAGGGKGVDKMNTTMTKKMEELQKDGKMDIESVFKKAVEFMKVKVKEFFGSNSNDSNGLFSAFKNMTMEGESDKFKNLMKEMKTTVKDLFGSGSNDSNDLFSAFENMTTEAGYDKFRNLMREMKILLKKMRGVDSAEREKRANKIYTMMTKKAEELQKDGKMDINSSFKKMVEFVKALVKEFFGSDPNDYNDLLSAFKNMTESSDMFTNVMKKIGGSDSAGGGLVGKIASLFNKKKN